jgi:hypothetical protein
MPANIDGKKSMEHFRKIFRRLWLWVFTVVLKIISNNGLRLNKGLGIVSKG